MADKKSLKDLLEDEIKIFYPPRSNCSRLCKMAKGSNDASEGCLPKTPGRNARPSRPPEKVAQLLETDTHHQECVGMEGVIQEGAEALEEEGEEVVLDIGLIGAGSRVEHYEMAGYLTAISLAKRMGATEVVALLSQSLTEEENAEKTLRKIAGEIN